MYSDVLNWRSWVPLIKDNSLKCDISSEGYLVLLPNMNIHTGT
jgi:hypothetical protein